MLELLIKIWREGRLKILHPSFYPPLVLSPPFSSAASRFLPNTQVSLPNSIYTHAHNFVPPPSMVKPNQIGPILDNFMKWFHSFIQRLEYWGFLFLSKAKWCKGFQAWLIFNFGRKETVEGEKLIHSEFPREPCGYT